MAIKSLALHRRLGYFAREMELLLGIMVFEMAVIIGLLGKQCSRSRLTALTNDLKQSNDALKSAVDKNQP